MRYRTFFAAAALALGSAGAAGQQATSPATAATQKVIAPPGAFAPGTPGTTLLADYGTFAVYRADANALARAPGTVKIAQAPDVLHFAARAFDTQRETPTAPARFAAQGAGASEAGLQVVQFVGPIKQAWLDALAARGIAPLQYVASYGYIVWADGAALTRLADLRAHSAWLQYAAPFQGFLKVDPALAARVAGANPGDEADVVVQIYRHDGDDETRRFVESRRIENPGPLARFSHAWAPILKFGNLTLRVPVAEIPAIAARGDVSAVAGYVEPEMLDEKQGLILAGETTPGPASPSYLQFLLDHGFSENPADYPIVDVTDSSIDEGGAPPTAVATADRLLHVHGNGNEPSRVAYFKNCSALATSATVGSDGHGSLNAGIIADYDQTGGFPFADADGQHLGLGINPFGRVGSTAIFVPVFSIDNCGGSDQGVIQSNSRSGAKISSNSWGAAVNGIYTASAQAYDVGVRDADPGTAGAQPMIYLFSAGNSGPGASTVGAPGTAKNVITVGASENLRPFDTPADSQCGFDPANDPQNVADFSSRGPVQGERSKPELIAPGTHVQGGASVSPFYDGSAVCVKYFPPGQTVFTYSSGTSHSTPAVAGVASLAYWWIEHGGAADAAGSIEEEGGNRAPSPALMKAWLMAHPSYLTGVGANDDLPGTAQGYGMPNLADMFSTTPKYVVDQTETFDATGEVRTYTLGVADPGKPVRVTLAWTDPPGALAAGSLVNDLDLTVAGDGLLFTGNAFAGNFSMNGGGEPDRTNNYEAVFIPPGIRGDLTITVSAANIADDGVPQSGDATDQDYALICSNCVLRPTFTLDATAATSVCTGATFSADVQVGSIDGFVTPLKLTLSGAPFGTVAKVTPGTLTAPPFQAQVTVQDPTSVAVGEFPLFVNASGGGIQKRLLFDLHYAADVAAPPPLLAPADGSFDVEIAPVLKWDAVESATSYLVEVSTSPDFATIFASAEVIDTSWQVAPALASSTRYYWRVRARNGCGLGAPASERVFGDGFDDTPLPEAQAGFTFATTGVPGDCGLGATAQVLLSEGAEAGAPGWFLGGIFNGLRWHIGNGAVTAHSGTHALLADNDPFLATVQELGSPAIALPADATKVFLSFWSQQSLQNVEPNACLDAADVEISVDGRFSFNQIVDGLLTDPYDGFVPAVTNNPLHDRMAWCGNPQAYTQSVVDLTPYKGQTVNLQFTMGNETRGESELPPPPSPGWAIDDITVTACRPN